MPHPEVTKQAKDVHKRLRKAIPSPRVELDHDGPWQLLVATILAAQSTDKKINEVTPALFAAYPTPEALGYAAKEDVERLVKPTGFFRNKAKAIMGASRAIADDFDGEVPRTMEALTTLPGVARKTANVVLGSGYGIATGIVVDTHVKRVSRRLELTVETDPVRIERELVELFPKRSWVAVSHRLVLHGRYVCQAKKPRCARCPLHEICAAAEGEPEHRAWTRRAAWERTLVESRGTVDDPPWD
ncbi:MAG TPA: endonuclease III [Sandaracinaceae bacterium LLY-WYZ-13_1]|nr:endonuclease III [Sandaracinaceae bacterium LLY-WYZ-13_1]